MILFFVIITTVNTYAQVRVGFGMRIPMHAPRKTAEQKADEEVHYLKKELALDKKQVKDVKALVLQRERLRKQHDKDGIRNLHFNQQMQSILTAEQYTAYLKLRDDKRRKQDVKSEKDTIQQSHTDDVYQ